MYNTHRRKTTYMDVSCLGEGIKICMGDETLYNALHFPWGLIICDWEPKGGTSNRNLPFLRSAAVYIYIVQFQKITILPLQKNWNSQRGREGL